MDEMIRHIEVEGSWNVRDLGGYETVDGRVTRWGRVIRAGNLYNVTAVGQQKLIDYGVKTIIDLRDMQEVGQEPDVFTESTVVAYRHLPIAQDVYTADYMTLKEMYCNYYDDFQTSIGMIVGEIADSKPGVLFHCFAGKDRTGIVAALLLGAVGVPDEVIAEDYALTSERITHLLEAWRLWAIEHGQNMERFEHSVSAEAQTMLETLGHIHERYGGAANYLSTCGVSDPQLERLYDLLIE
jgi:protein-tyrosine phosphatase